MERDDDAKGGGQTVTTDKTDDHRAADRGPRGHFAPGNRLAAGNPNTKRMHKLRQAFLDAVNEGTIPALARKLQVDALKGDEFAVRMLLDYCLGKPAQAVELSGPEGESLGVNIGAITTIILSVLAGPQYAEARIALAAKLKELGRMDAA